MSKITDEVREAVCRILADVQFSGGFRDRDIDALADRILAAALPHLNIEGASGFWWPIETHPVDGGPFIVGAYNGRGQWCPDIWSPMYCAEERKRISEGFYKDAPHLLYSPIYWMALATPPAFPAPRQQGGQE